jgi:outer membrane protein assembly factor BamB
LKTSIKLATSTLLILALASSSLAGLFVPTKAQVETGAPQLTPWPTTVPAGVTPNVTLATLAFMSVSPNPIGVGQSFLVNLWLEPPVHYNRYFSGYTVTITKPDGNTETIGPMSSYQGDSTAWFQYMAAQVGIYKFKFDFPGNYFPAGWYYNGIVYANVSDITDYTPGGMGFGGPAYLESAYYQPSTSIEQSLTVQDEIVSSWPPAALPTDYWVRPIPIENREWWTIGGHFPFTGQGGGPDWPANTNTYASNYKFTPYVEGPETSHVAWKVQGALAGIAGGQFGQRSVGPGEATYAGTPNIIFQGRGYQTIRKPMPMTVGGNTVIETTNVWQCYDIRTGKIHWEQTGITQPPTVITFNEVKPSVPGAEQTGMGTGSFSLMYIGPRLIKYDPWDGRVTLNVSLPVTSGIVYRDPFVLSIQNLGGGNYRLINWTTTGTSTNFNTRIMSNVSFPFNSIRAADYEQMIALNYGSITPAGAGSPQGQFVMAASLTTGNLLWNVTINDIFFPSGLVADQGKVSVRVLGGWWDCWDIRTGQLLWQSPKPGEAGGESYPWGDFGAYTIASYGGLIYDFSYAGIYALDWNTGNIAWHFMAPSAPFEYATYPSLPFFSNAPQIADGKLYYANGEHSPTQPLARGWRLWCLNATTGEHIWDISGGGAAGAVADGYLTYDNKYDGHLYVFGKGPSETTVSAPQTAITAGTSAMILGTVLDQSPAQPGAACVSKDSMTTYMEYLHMQRPIDGFYHNVTVTGVPVTIDSIDPNNNHVPIGTTTTDAEGNFGLVWTPTIPGRHQIIVTFAGDDSYASSMAITYAVVTEAPPETPPPETQPDMTGTYVTNATIAIIVAIAIVGAILALLMFKRKP